MYAGSLVKIFEQDIGPAFQSKTGYTYTGEGRGLTANCKYDFGWSEKARCIC